MKYRKEILAEGKIEVRAIIFRGNTIVGEKRFHILDEGFFGSFKADEIRRKNNFIKAHSWADTYIEQMEEFENGKF